MNLIKKVTIEKMNADKYDLVARRIIKETGVNIFDKRRTLEIVDARAMACYIYNKYYGGTLHGISRYFNSKGKRFDHSTVYYNINLFDQEVKERRKDLTNNLMYYVGKIDGSTSLNIILDTVLTDEDQERIINVVNRLALKYQNRNVI
jgi:hypothetical protein